MQRSVQGEGAQVAQANRWQRSNEVRVEVEEIEKAVMSNHRLAL